MSIKVSDGYDLVVRQGEDYIKYFQWTLADGKTPVNLTSFTGTCQIRENAQSNTIIATPTITIADAINGVFKISISNAITSTIPTSGEAYRDYNFYTYDIKMTDSSGLVYRVLNGYAKISPGVTK